MPPASLRATRFTRSSAPELKPTQPPRRLGPVRAVGVGEVRPDTVALRRRLYTLARVVVARHHRRRLTLPVVAVALASSPRQLQRA